MALKENKPKELFEKAKTWWESKTIWASIVAMAFIVGDMVGINLESIVGADGAVNDTVETGNLIYNKILAVISLAIAWWGRVKATKVIK